MCSHIQEAQSGSHTTVVTRTHKAATKVLALKKHKLLLRNIFIKESIREERKQCQKVIEVQEGTGSQNQRSKGRVWRTTYPNHGILVTLVVPFEVPIVPVDPLVAPEVGAVYVISSIGVIDLVDSSSSSDSDPSEDSLPLVQELALVSPFLCSDDLEADSDSEPAEQRSERHESLAFHDAMVSSKDATDREIFEMCQGRFGLVDVIEENEETKNESEVEKRKLKEFKEEFTTGLNRDENKEGTSGARHGNDNDDVNYDGHCNDADDIVHANHGDVHVNGNDEVDFAEENKANEMGEKAEKEAAEKKKAEMQKAATEKKERAEMQAAAEAKLKDKMQKDAEEKKQSPSKKKEKNKSEPTAEKDVWKRARKYRNPKGKRITKPSVYLKSPFVNKMVKTQDKLDEDEILCARSIFCMQGDISEVVFDDGKGTIAHRKEMRSLTPGIEIEKQIIDTLVTVLNYEERIRTDEKDLRRRYFPTYAVVNEDQAKKYESFENVIKNQTNASESMRKMKDVELAFFPTVVDAESVVPQILANHQHPCVEKLSKDKPAKVLKIKWKTKKNKIDSGVYMMMHMELYQGESATFWKTDIVQENNRDYDMQMTSMRMRYTTKILIQEMNTKRGLMSRYAKKFSEDNKDEKIKKMAENAINRKIAEKENLSI
nr:hypothetical protein [Tanacetum cinerariifolium]